MSEAENVNFTNLKNEAIAFRDDALGKLETSALGATVGFLSSLTSTLSSFREMVSNPLDTLSTSLQGQLRDLTNLDIDLAAGIADPIAAARNIAQSSNLLESIKTDFGQSLTDAGFDVDSLVSDASAAVSAGKSLSGIIPNFELNSIGDIVLKASGVKLPAIDPVKELTATFVDNVDFIQAGSDAVSDLQTLLDFDVADALPTVDTGVFRVSDIDIFKDVTQASNGISITKAVTVADQAFQNNSRKTVSSNGFSNRISTIPETFTDPTNITLSNDPIQILLVIGKTQTAETVGSKSIKSFVIDSSSGSSHRDRIKTASYERDTFSVSGKNITIDQKFRQYDHTTEAIKVIYKYYETYDPGYSI